MNIIIAGGGTGGHLFPGIAIAQEFIKHSPQNKIAFIGSSSGLEARILPKLKYTLETITVKGFKGKTFQKKLACMWSVPGALMHAAAYIRRFRPDIIIGVGGYISFPALVAGYLLRVPTVIHEQNSIPGMANRILGKCARRIFISYESSRDFFPTRKAIFSGLPVRQKTLSKAAAERQEPFCIFISGGSQGAREINLAVTSALPHLKGFKNKIRFMHQTGATDLKQVQENYRQFGFSARVFAFTDDMFACYRQSHLVICRAGAASLAELSACSRTALLIPFPFATDNHQEINANTLVDTGAALMIRSRELDPAEIARIIMHLEQNRRELQLMETRSAALYQPQAASIIVDECRRLARHQGKN